MTPNPEFDTRSWPTVNANGMKSRSKFRKWYFGGFDAQGVRDAIAAGKSKSLLRFMFTKSHQAARQSFNVPSKTVQKQQK